MITLFRATLLLCLIAGASCTKKAEEPAASSSGMAPANAAAAATTPTVPAVDTTGLSDELRADLTALEKAGSSEAAGMIAAHRQLVANMIATSNAEMRAMNMTADAAWNATVDSLRRDLVTLANQRPAELKGILPAHAARVRRLGAMHAAMLRSMKH